MSEQAWFLLTLIPLWAWFGHLLYMLAGGRRWWGPRRGEPYCGHPFEQTWGMNPRPTRWQCPKCRTPFEVQTHADGVRRWMMVR